jgi:chromosome segregation ATPase
MKADGDDAEPLRLKLRMLKAERDSLMVDLERIEDRIEAVDAEIADLSGKLERILLKARVRRIK